MDDQPRHRPRAKGDPARCSSFGVHTLARPSDWLGPEASLVVMKGDQTQLEQIWIALGPDRLSEPFATWTDGTYSVLRLKDEIAAIPPTNTEAIRRHVWVGTDMDDLVPRTLVNTLEAGTHRHRGHVFDADWWFCGLWADNEDLWYAFLHAEDKQDIPENWRGWGNDLRTIALWTSRDQGANWEYAAPVVTIADRFPMPPASQMGWPRNGGAGDHKLVVSPKRDFLYILYTNFTYEKPVEEGVDCARGNLAIARARLSPEGAPGPWYKFYEGDFAEPGVGGNETWLSSPAAGDPDNSQRTVTWSRYLNRYVMIFSPRSAGCRITFSDDLIHWDESTVLIPHGQVGLHYFNLIDFEPLGTDTSIGQVAWLYYTRADYEVHRRLIRFENGDQRREAGGLAVSVRDDPGLVAPQVSPPRSGAEFNSSTDFGGTQGGSGWGYVTIAPLRPNPRRTEHWSPMDFDQASQSWTREGIESAIGTDWQQAGPGMDCARFWRSPWACRIRINFNFTHRGPDSTASAVRILHNRTQMWPRDETWHFLTATAPHMDDHLELDVLRGDRIFLILCAPQVDPARIDVVARIKTL
jgi:hypothetical protein